MSENTYRFDSLCGRFNFVINTDFLKIVAKPEELDIYSLMAEKGMAKFLHNPNGPAITHIATKKCEYWLKGDRIPDEEGERMLHNYNFNHKLIDDVLKD